MLEMFLYGIGVMYTPGPVNLLGANQGFNKKFKSSFSFFVGVGVAMFLLFIIYGYSGEKLIKKEYLIYISLVGSCYIIYLAYKIYTEKIEIHPSSKNNTITFKDGFLMQLFNPKASLTALPIATINFPANNITGINIAFMSFLFMVLVIGAPSTYCILGQFFSKLIKNNGILMFFNKIMAILLIYVAFTILKDHVYYVLIGLKPF
ncbi:LysE family translocator [Calidifontibacillus oryziterrae]|uniref:LysE family translocator n=1 Tax=Calidifontibacillus oryziterrae TaxID=1191699 RepID=UPI0002D6DC53|nr:LysE family transporter [Calidifontibacillus oryziterrae]